MTPTNEVDMDIRLIEARARAMRAQMVREAATAAKRWIAARLASLRLTQTRARHS